MPVGVDLLKKQGWKGLDFAEAIRMDVDLIRQSEDTDRIKSQAEESLKVCVRAMVGEFYRRLLDGDVDAVGEYAEALASIFAVADDGQSLTDYPPITAAMLRLESLAENLEIIRNLPSLIHVQFMLKKRDPLGLPRREILAHLRTADYYGILLPRNDLQKAAGLEGRTRQRMHQILRELLDLGLIYHLPVERGQAYLYGLTPRGRGVCEEEDIKQAWPKAQMTKASPPWVTNEISIEAETGVNIRATPGI